MIKLLVKEIDDEKVRENFKRIQKELTETQIILKGQWKFFELTFLSDVTNMKYPHKLGFTPKDVIQTSIIGDGEVTWNYSLFDGANLDITTSDACVVRAFIGSYLEGSGQL